MDELIGRDGESIWLSRSSFDHFSSSCFVLNDHDDEYASHQQQQLELECNMNHDAFIELDLRSSVPQAATGNVDDDKELDYIRISFSALAGFRPSFINSQLTVTPPCNNNINNSAGPRDQSIDTCPATTVSILPPPPVDHGNDYTIGCGLINDTINMSWKLLRSRKTSLSAAKVRGENGGIMKMLVKMRCILSSSLGSVGGASSLIRRPLCRASSSCTADDRTYNTLIRWFTWPRNLCQLITTLMRSPSTKVELVSDHDPMKLDAMSRNYYLFGSCSIMSPLKKAKTGSKNGSRSRGRGRGRGRLNKSCPTSVKSSPAVLDQSGDLSLLHAAIAHCKKSFHGEIDTDHISF